MKINYQTPEVHKKTVLFENLTPLYPEKKISFITEKYLYFSIKFFAPIAIIAVFIHTQVFYC